MKVDGAVLPWRESPVCNAPVPRMSGHSPRRQVDGAPGPGVGPEVGDRGPFDAGGEVPGAEQTLARFGRGGLLGDRPEPREPRRRPGQHRPLDLAVVVRAAHPAPVGRPRPVRTDEKRSAGRRCAPGEAVERCRRGAGKPRKVFESEPADAGPTRPRLEVRGDEGPAPLQERFRARRVEHPFARAEAKAERAALVDLEREPRPVGLRPPSQHRLAAPSGSGRPDERTDRDAPAVRKPRRVVDPHV